MPYPNDRRKGGDNRDDAFLSPEYLAMLVACGGEVRASDREVLQHAGIERRHGRRKDDLPMPGNESGDPTH